MSLNNNYTNYETDLFIEEPDGELKCQICLCVMKEPHQLSVCQYMSCKNYITTHLQSIPATHNCPIDRLPANASNIIEAPRAISNKISRVQIKCFFYEQGCQEILCVQNVNRHAQICTYNCNRVSTSNRAAVSEANTSNVGIPFNVMVKLASTGETIIVSIYSNETVMSVKLKIQEKEGLDPNHMVLNFKGKSLMNAKRMDEYGVKSSDLLYLTRRFEGGKVYK